MLARLPLIQTFYPLLARVCGLEQFVGFQWITGCGLDAVTNFERGWIAILWSGLLEKESVLQERMEKLWRDFRVFALNDESLWSGQLCIVVSDQWQREDCFVWCIKETVENWERDKRRTCTDEQGIMT